MNVKLYFFLFLSSPLFAQYIAFEDIRVTSNIDSLRNVIPQQRGYSLLQCILSAEKSFSFWNRDEASPYILLLDSLCKHYPECKAHFYYFKAKHELFDNSNEKAFQWSKKAFDIYKSTKDTSGMASALVSMGAVTVSYTMRADSEKQFSRAYFQEAFHLGQQSSSIEARLVGNYALVRLFGIDFQSGNLNKIIAVSKQSLQLINRNRKYKHYKVLFLGALAMAYDIKNEDEAALNYNLEWLELLKSEQASVPFVMMNNIGFVYLKQQDYPLAISYYKQALSHPMSHNTKNAEILRNVFNGYHKALIGSGSFKEASVFADSIYFYSEKFRNEENNRVLNELIVQYETQKKEAQSRQLQQQIELATARERLYWLAGSIIVIGLILAIFLVYYLNRKNIQLANANREISRLTKAKDYFFSILAHDLRHPLNAYQDMTELVDYYVSTKRFDALQKISKSINQSGRKIRQLLDNLLQWALSQQNEVPYQPKELVLYPILSNVLDLYRPIIDKNNVQATINGSEYITAFVDELAFELIIRNLVDNALKYLRPEGELEISINTTSSGQTQLSIKDNGEGMTTEKLEAIRYMLSQADQLLPGQIGRSLGMLLIGRFVKSNKGTIRVESQPQAGTVFTLLFPQSSK